MRIYVFKKSIIVASEVELFHKRIGYQTVIKWLLIQADSVLGYTLAIQVTEND